MEQCKWLARLYFNILWIILISVEKTDTTCVLPPVLAHSVWTYRQNVTTGQATFGKSTMAGFGVTVRGNELKDFHCISNTTDVYVFKSDGTYSDRGKNRWIYRCMKVTKVTENLVYLYFLSDLDSTVIPPSRMYSPLPDNVPADDQSTCSFCNYTQPPKAEEYFLLKRENTDEKMTMTPNPCLPCQADCTKDHCDPNPCQNGGVCTSGSDGYTCKCTAGWMNKNCSVKCGPNNWGTDCSQTCQCILDKTAECDNMDGSCTCNSGWTDSTCSEDIDECTTSPTICNAVSNSKCINLNGSYACDCVSGYKKTADGKCQDKDAQSGEPHTVTIVIIVIVAILVIVIIILVVRYVVRKRRNTSNKKYDVPNDMKAEFQHTE